jgi:phosphocarrier protein
MAETKLIVRNEVGLHARPAALFVDKARGFDSEITVACDGRTANAKSILGVLALGAEQGAEITVRAEGEDAPQALEALRELLNGGFGGEA